MKTPSPNKSNAGRKRLSHFVSAYPNGPFTISEIVKLSTNNTYQTIFQRVQSDLRKQKIELVGSRQNPETKARENLYQLKNVTSQS